jgi:hypothetical protein
MSIAVKNQSPAKRCEICHQTDSFDPIHNNCHRCSNVHISSFTPLILAQENTSAWSGLLCRVGFHKWHNSRWERFCLRCRTSQHVWRIIDRSILWRNTDELIDDEYENVSDFDSEVTPLPLRRWQCENCQHYVMRIHPPGIFEPCQYCGTINYVAREKTPKNHP